MQTDAAVAFGQRLSCFDACFQAAKKAKLGAFWRLGDTMTGIRHRRKAAAPWGEAQKGLAYAVFCCVLWGLFPLYWYPLLGQPIGADQLLAQRIVWSSLLAAALMVWQRQWLPLWRALQSRRVWQVFTASALLLSVNWLTYLWAITHQQVLDASLGYFMAPLVSIVLARVFLKERLPLLQWLAAALVAVGVLWLALPGGRLPWVALSLSISWSFYGLLRKQAPLGALTGLALETLLMLPLALAYLAWHQAQNTLVFAQLPAVPLLLVLGSGLVTTVPLLLFAAAARRISLADLGMMQYVAPTLQFALGLWVFQETFDAARFVGYLWVWVGVLLFAAISYRRHRKG